ncbi:MAG TPA: hypothetical protein VGO00_09520 [Kofleriaceae bacterium]|jgi:hypothetical protein|nr:hypothetical protein [Kofleriaceae bacterium]
MKHLLWVIALSLVLGACVREVVLIAPPLPDGGIGDGGIPSDVPGDADLDDGGGAD